MVPDSNNDLDNTFKQNEVFFLKPSLSLQAYQWYELGHKRGHFASVWQRSLYNVDGLKAQPWWTPKETGYTDLVKVKRESSYLCIHSVKLSITEAVRVFSDAGEELEDDQGRGSGCDGQKHGAVRT